MSSLNYFAEHGPESGWGSALADWQRRLAVLLIPVLVAICTCIFVSSSRLEAQDDAGWRISPEKINLQQGEERQFQVLNEFAEELLGATWSVDDPAKADVREEDGRAVVLAKAEGTVRVYATLNGEKKFREIKIWTNLHGMPPGTTRWGTHSIGRDLGDISAVPTPEGPSIFSLEQTANGNTYLRGVRSDGIQIWDWLMPEKTRDAELVCGDWLGGALISANRGDSFTLYTVGNDGKLRWQVTLAGIRKGHAYNREHVMNVISQSQDGLITKINGIDQETGGQKFELTLPASHETQTSVRQSGAQMQCEITPSTHVKPSLASHLFVNIDDFAYVAFTQSESTMTAPVCQVGALIPASEVNVTREETVLLWQIHPDGTFRSTVVETSKTSSPLSSPVIVTAPTGAIIPDGLGGVLLSMRKAVATPPSQAKTSTDEFVYRIDEAGGFLYKMLLPKYTGKLNDEMVLGEENVGFATRGGILVAFHVEDGKEMWRWTSPQEVEVFAALANGHCMVQTPTAVLEVENATTAKKYMDGKVMMDWQGNIYKKHN